MHIPGKRLPSLRITPEFNRPPSADDHRLNLIREFRHCIEVKPGVLSEFLALEPVQPFLSADASLHDTLTGIARDPSLLERDPKASQRFFDFLQEAIPALWTDPSVETVAAFHARHGMPANLAQVLQAGGLTRMRITKKDCLAALTTLKHVIHGCSGLRDLEIALSEGFSGRHAAEPWACTGELVALLAVARGLSSLTLIELDLQPQDLDLLGKGLKQMQGLTLKMRGHRIGPDAIATLLSPLPCLKGLHLSGVEMSDKDMKALCEWARSPDRGLRDIRLKGCSTRMQSYDDLMRALLSNPYLHSVALDEGRRPYSAPRSGPTQAPVFHARLQALTLQVPGLGAACPWVRDCLRETEALETLELSCVDMTASDACELVDALKQHANLRSLKLDAVSLHALPSLSGALAKALPHAFQRLTGLLIAVRADKEAWGNALREACASAIEALQPACPPHRLRFAFDPLSRGIGGRPATGEAPLPCTGQDPHQRIATYLGDANALLVNGKTGRARRLLENAVHLWCDTKKQGVLPQRKDAPGLSPALTHVLLQQICEGGWLNLKSRQLAEFAAAWNVPARAIAAAQRLKALRG